MKNIAAVFFIFSCTGTLVNGQKPEELLGSWSAKSPVEKVYLHCDRDNYLAGETVWFKGYLYSDFSPDTISTTLYAELQNASSGVLSAKVFPVIYGTAKGQFELPDSLVTGNYYIRAYSPTMLNHGQDFLFQRSIYVSGRKILPVTSPAAKKTKVEFFPESGNFVAGVPNTIGFKITDEQGLPLDREGVVRNESGDSIAAISCYHDGMGMFDLNPSKDKKYYAVLKDDPGTKYYLPAVSPSGMVFRLMARPDGRYFELFQQPGNPALKPDYMIGQMQHHVVFKMKLNGDKNDLNGFINTQKLNSGVLQVTVFNKDDMPLAERLSFIDNKEYLQKAELITDTVNFSQKAMNHFTLAFPDTVAGTFSVAITDPDYATGLWRTESIISHLLLTSDLKGYVHQPVYYFSAEPDSARTAVDLLMMTNGWRRFKWTELAAIAAQAPQYQDPGYITITGKVNIRDTKKPLPDKDLFLLLIPKEDSLRSSMNFMTTDAGGKFRLDSLIFFGKTSFFVSDMQEKKKKWLDIYPDADSIRSYSGLFRGPKYMVPGETVPDALSSRLAYDYEAISKAKGVMMEGITVTAKKKTPVQELEERYASGLFSGMTEKTIDLVNTTESVYQNNIFDYLQGRVPGLRVANSGLDYQVYYRNRSSLMGGPIPMLLFLDEMPTDSRIIASVPANQVSMVKVFSTFMGAEGNAPGGALAVYTKKGGDRLSALSTSADIFEYKGYSVIKEFYSPNYSAGPGGDRDQRITLHWQPDILVGGDTKVSVRFYNNERSESFKVVVEGMTADGKLVFIEKLVSPKKGF